MTKISIRFFDDREVRAVWDEAQAKWWFSVVDIVGVLKRATTPRQATTGAGSSASS
ncbi:MAG: hypothetical protein ACK46G_01660 [Flavobacteriales bacterium]|jgi:hypothetical protein